MGLTFFIQDKLAEELRFSKERKERDEATFKERLASVEESLQQERKERNRIESSLKHVSLSSCGFRLLFSLNLGRWCEINNKNDGDGDDDDDDDDNNDNNNNNNNNNNNKITSMLKDELEHPCYGRIGKYESFCCS